MRNYKASCSESPCVGMNRRICLSLFPHRPLPFHGLTFADGGWLLMHLQTFAERCFSHGSCQGWKEKQGEGEQVELPKGLFSLVVPRSWLGGGIAPQRLKARVADQLCKVVTHVPDPALAKGATPVNQLHREEVVGRRVSRQGQRDGGQDVPLPSPITPFLWSRGFPRLKLNPAPERQGQLTADA